MSRLPGPLLVRLIGFTTLHGSEIEGRRSKTVAVAHALEKALAATARECFLQSYTLDPMLSPGDTVLTGPRAVELCWTALLTVTVCADAVGDGLLCIK